MSRRYPYIEGRPVDSRALSLSREDRHIQAIFDSILSKFCSDFLSATSNCACKPALQFQCDSGGDHYPRSRKRPVGEKYRTRLYSRQLFPQLVVVSGSHPPIIRQHELANICLSCEGSLRAIKVSFEAVAREKSVCCNSAQVCLHSTRALKRMGGETSACLLCDA